MADITIASPTAAKINLFRSLFRGRADVFPRRWENARTGKAGYAPACRNEWIRFQSIKEAAHNVMMSMVVGHIFLAYTVAPPRPETATDPRSCRCGSRSESCRVPVRQPVSASWLPAPFLRSERFRRFPEKLRCRSHPSPEPRPP